MNTRLIPAILMSLFIRQSLAQGKIVVNITNIKNDKGVCRTCLFNNSSAFNGETGQPVRCLSIAVKNKTAQANFENIPAGKYAVMVFHDANSNNKIDRNFLGIPKEGYGASKNKLPFASAPTFDDNMFILKDRTTSNISINLRNL